MFLKCPTGLCLNMKTVFLIIMIPIIKIRLSYLYNGNHYTDKMAKLCWDGPLEVRLFHVPFRRAWGCLWPLKRQGIPCLFKIPTLQHSLEKEIPFIYITLVMAQYSPCLFEYVTIGLARHKWTNVSETKEAVYRPMSGASWCVKQTSWRPLLG